MAKDFVRKINNTDTTEPKINVDSGNFIINDKEAQAWMLAGGYYIPLGTSILDTDGNPLSYLTVLFDQVKGKVIVRAQGAKGQEVTQEYETSTLSHKLQGEHDGQAAIVFDKDKNLITYYTYDEKHNPIAQFTWHSQSSLITFNSKIISGIDVNNIGEITNLDNNQRLGSLIQNHNYGYYCNNADLIVKTSAGDKDFGKISINYDKFDFDNTKYLILSGIITVNGVSLPAGGDYQVMIKDDSLPSIDRGIIFSKFFKEINDDSLADNVNLNIQYVNGQPLSKQVNIRITTPDNNIGRYELPFSSIIQLY